MNSLDNIVFNADINYQNNNLEKKIQCANAPSKYEQTS